MLIDLYDNVMSVSVYLQIIMQGNAWQEIFILVSVSDQTHVYCDETTAKQHVRLCVFCLYLLYLHPLSLFFPCVFPLFFFFTFLSRVYV